MKTRWPRGMKGDRRGKRKPGGGTKGKIMECLARHGKDLEFYDECNGETLGRF